MKKKSMKRVVALLLSMAMMLSGCGSSTSQTPDGTTEEVTSEASETTTVDSSRSGGVVKMAREQDSEKLDPVLASDNNDIWVINMMLEGLVASSDDGKEIIPAVADTWEISEDGLVYTFHIRDGIQFSNGESVTVEDCIYSITRSKEMDGPWIGMLDMIDSMEDAGDNILKMNLKYASPALLSTLAMFSCSIMPEAYCEEVGDEGIAENPIGTGPFILQEWAKGEKMIFVKNPYYWEEGCPKVDEVDMLVVGDDNTRIMQLESGQVDMASQIPYSRIAEVDGQDGITVNLFDSTEIRYVIVNCQSEYLNDPRVRKALKLATDKEAINEAVYFGYAKVAESYISPAAPHYNENLPESKVDIEGAKALLAEAGYPDGISIKIEVGSGDSTNLTVATMLQEQWAEIGVTLEIQQLDYATIRQDWKDGNYDVFLSYLTSDMTDTSELAGLWCIYDQTSCFYSYWNDDDQKKVEELCIAANQEMDESVRAKQYGEIQEITAESCPNIPFVCTPFTLAVSDKVSGAVQTPLGIYNFKNLVINE